MWHPSYCAAIKLDLREYRRYLEYHIELSLNVLPRRIDLLVIVMRENIKIEKKIAAIFRKYNLFEFKSPDDTLTVNDYYNALSYALQYKSTEKNKISISELTLTFVCSNEPKELFRHLQEQYDIIHSWHLKEKHSIIHCWHKGIYAIRGTTIPVQILVINQLDKNENLFLGSMQKQLDKETALKLYTYSHPEELPQEDYNTYLEAVTKANYDTFMEVMDMLSLEQPFKDMSEEERIRLIERGEQICVKLGFSKKWEKAMEEERRVIEEERRTIEKALEKERLAKEKAIEKERLAKENERLAKEENKKLLERIKQLEANQVGQ